MSERGPHEYETEEAAMEYLTDGIVTNKETLLNHFRKMDLDHNKARDKGVYDWVVVKARLKSHIRQFSLFPNAQFSSSITDAMLHESDVVISQNATAHFLQKVEIFCKKAVVILIGNHGENAPTLPNFTPIAVFDIVTKNPLLIEQEFTTLPTTSVKASLYLPGAPPNGNLAKMKFLSNRAMEKRCSLGTIMDLKDSHTLAYFADFYDTALFCNINLKICTHFINALSCFSKIIVSGEKELQELVSETIKPLPTIDSEEE
uniref:Uncharacterized protein n=1 Tax=Panagrolaimus sp. PS1159 TaxID=55785 RepID=A0AC35FZT6_9BILA